MIIKYLKISIIIFLNTCSLSFEVSACDSYLLAQVIGRQEWGASTPCCDMDLDTIKYKFAVHHSAGSAISSGQTVKDIQSFHMNERKWSDIGYHFLIGVDGKCFEGRELKWQGAHVAKHNKGNIGLCFLGCFESSEANMVEPTNEMIIKMGEMIGVLAAKYDIDVSRVTVKGHKEHEDAHTLCPGDLVLARMDEIVVIAEKKKRECLQDLFF